MIRAGFYQFRPVFGEIRRNVESVLRRLDRIDRGEADLIVLPELFNTGYQFISRREVAELSEGVPGGFTTRRLGEFAEDKKLWLVAGLSERAVKCFYNSAVLIGPKGYVATYRKVHLFYEEKLWFKPGMNRFRSYDIGKARIGIMVCFDWFFPEAARSLALAGAEIICHPANLVLPYCPDAMVTRSLENGVFAITANRIGSEQRGGKKRLTYIGQSEVVDPKGRILFRAPRNQETLKILEIHPREARHKTLNRYNNLFRDRRVGLYNAGRKVSL
jgi:predicted amidohydrolase